MRNSGFLLTDRARSKLPEPIFANPIVGLSEEDLDAWFELLAASTLASWRQ
jgi:hypothetical protein